MGKAGNKARQSQKEKKALQEQGQAVIEMQRAGIIGPDDEVPWNDIIPPAGDLSEAKRRVTLLPDHKLEYPELYMDIYIEGDQYDQAAFAAMFARAGCSRAKSLAEADLCVFSGGPDVDPILYGETPHKETNVNHDRDKTDMDTYLFCLERGIPMLGVCRGAQFLHVMNGGRLYQHVDNHHGDHSMIDTKEKRLIDKVSSVHHQMVRENVNGGMEILATTNKARNRWLNPKDNDIGTRADIEAFFYRATCCIGVQGHPEYRDYNQFQIWTLKQIENFVVMNLDTDWVGGNRRIKPDLLEQRKGKDGMKIPETLLISAKTEGK